MCGIVGVLRGSDSPQLDADLLARMRDTLVHRGPDSGGLWLDPAGAVGLGHRRLAIVDLAPAANQPLVSDRGNALVYNGEIYNHLEIRRALESEGVSFRTDHSDSETLLRALEQWGAAALNRTIGMFAFAYWDANARELLVVRDRIGIKPVYYTEYAGQFVFASEIKALLADPACPRRLDEEAFVDYLSFLTVPAPRTLFRDIHKLEAGHLLRVRPGEPPRRERWWSVWQDVTPRTRVTRDELVEELRSTLEDAVAIRKMADVPVGVFLSGGVDSSTNAALFSRGESRPVRTFTVGYDQEYASYESELEPARHVAEFVGSEHAERRLTLDDLLGFLDPMVELQDEPIADPVCFPVHFVSKLARDHGVTVCQVGEGADELFWGYPYWKQVLDLERRNRWPVPNAVKRLGLRALAAAGKDESYAYELLRRGTEGLPLFWGGAEAFRDTGRSRVLSPRLQETFRGRSGWDAIAPFRQSFEREAWEKSSLAWMSTLDLSFRLPELLLMRVDKMAMGVSLEARVPFLDHRLVAFAMSIPAAERTKDGVLKGLLKEAVTGWVPDEVIHRPKQGFGVPVHEWFLDRLGERARSEIRDFNRDHDLLSSETVESLFTRRRGSDLWVLLNAALWAKRYL